MDINVIIGAIERIQSLGDRLDEAGKGVKAATNGRHTTREVLKTELGQFLLHIAGKGSNINDAQAAILNLLLGDVSAPLDADKLMELSEALDEPDPENNLSLTVFMQTDLERAQTTGDTEPVCTNGLISTYKVLGHLMIELNKSAYYLLALAQSWYDVFIIQMRTRALLLGLSPNVDDDDEDDLSTGIANDDFEIDDDDSDETASDIAADDDFEIDDDVLTEYLGNDSHVVVPDGITRIDDRAFSMNDSIQSIVLPDSVTVIGEGAFAYCDSLESINLPEGLTEIESDAFAHCDSLTSIEIPSTVETISHDAFGNCSKLKRIRINTPTALADVGDNAFYKLDSLEAVVVCGKKRNTSTINKLKAFFPEDVTVFWQGDPQESVILGQVIRDGQNTLFAFKPGIMISLPSDEYDFELVEEGQLHEGNLKITPRQKMKDGDRNFEFFCMINEPWGTEDDVFKKIEGWFAKYYFFVKEYSTTPRAHIMLQSLSLRFDLAISKEKSLEIDMGSWASDESDFRTAIIQLISIWRGVTINGNKAMFNSISSDALVEEWINEYKAGCQREEDEAKQKQNRKIEKGKNKVKKHVAKYNDMVSFDLPAGSELIWKDAEDGSKVGEIADQVLVDDDDSVEYNKLIVIRDLTVQSKEDSDDSSQSAIELMIDEIPGCRHKMLCNAPDTALIVSDRSISFVGSPIKVVEIDIVVNYAPGKILRMLYAEPLERIKTDKAAIFRLMLDVAKRIRFNEKPLMIPDLNCDELGQQMILDDFEAESLGSVGLKVVVNGKEVEHIGSFGGDEEDGIPFAVPQVADQYHEHYTIVTSGQYTTHRDADFVGQSIRMLMEKCDNESKEAYDLMEMADDDYSLDDEGRRLAKVFRLDEHLFDPYKDTEAMIRLGMFENARMFHILRSLAWTISCKADREGRMLDSYDFEELKEIGDYLDEHDLNYSADSYCSGLCSHYDWHVFYVPDAYIDSDCADNTDLRLLCGKENRGGNTISIMFPGMGLDDFRRSHSISDLISRNEETLESLEALRKDLTDLLPVMRTIYNGFMEDRDRSEKLEGPLAEALTAWCTLAIAAKEPFYSEEAADTYEADAGLDGPMKRPTDDLEETPVARKAGGASKPAPKKAPRTMPKGEVLDLGGATVIEAGQFNGNMTLKDIIIPEGVTEIGKYAFYSCMFLETVVLPKSLRKIGEMAFMSCRNLKQVEIPEGVEEIETHAFGATNNLKEVHLPDSLKVVDSHIFGMGGDSPYATAYMSGELAQRLQANSKNSRFSSAVYARRYVIDGVGYENMYDYHGTISSTAADNTKKSAQSKTEKKAADANAGTADKSKETINKISAKKPVAKEPFGTRKTASGRVKASGKDSTAREYGNDYKQYISSEEIIFEGKIFVFYGFTAQTQDWIEERLAVVGAEIRLDISGATDYLVIKDAAVKAGAKLNKAVDLIEKGHKIRIILLEDMENALDAHGISSDSYRAIKKGKMIRTVSGKTKSAEECGDMLELAGAKTIKEGQFCKNRDLIGRMIIPEGVTTIEDSAFKETHITEVVFPRSLKKIEDSAFHNCKELKKIELNDGLEEIGSLAFGYSTLREVDLPDSLKKVDSTAFATGIDAGRFISGITVQMSSMLANYFDKNREYDFIAPFYAAAYIIDGERYSDFNEYSKKEKEREKQRAEAEEKERQAREIREREEAERRAKTEREEAERRAKAEREEAARRAAEERKQKERERINMEILQLTNEMNSLKGLFAGMKRKKLQARIDELKQHLELL